MGGGLWAETHVYHHSEEDLTFWLSHGWGVQAKLRGILCLPHF